MYACAVRGVYGRIERVRGAYAGEGRVRRVIEDRLLQNSTGMPGV